MATLKNRSRKSPRIRLFSSTSHYAEGIINVLPDFEWNISSYTYDYINYEINDDEFYFISLYGCTAEQLLRTLCWLQIKSCSSTFPIILLNDSSHILPALFESEIFGRNCIYIDGKISVKYLKEVLLKWIHGVLKSEPIKTNLRTITRRELAVLNRYLLVKDMNKVARFYSVSVKTVYKQRQNALHKLGFTRLRDFLQYHQSQPKIRGGII